MYYLNFLSWMYVDTKSECRLWACCRPRKICVHNIPYIPETLRLGKLYHIFRREMQPIKQWKQKQEYIFICGSSTVYIIVKLCLMFNSLFSFMRLKDFFIKPRTDRLLSFQPITENQSSWSYRAVFRLVVGGPVGRLVEVQSVIRKYIRAYTKYTACMCESLGFLRTCFAIF